MQWYKYFILAFLIIFPTFVRAEITINEVYPAPKDNEYEWIELYNSGDQPVNTDQYILKDLTGKSLVFNASSIQPHGYGTATSSAVLNNKDESIFLTNKAGDVIETVTYSFQFDSEKSYSKCEAGWQVSSLSKLLVNSCPLPTLVPTIQPSTTVPTPTTTISSIDGISINEIMANPASGEHEWIELYNKNDTDTTLSNWLIDSHQFSLTLPAHGYGTIEITTSLFKNAGDTVTLFDSNKNSKNTFTYSDSEKGLSIGRVAENSSELCIQQPSKNQKNTSCHTANTLAQTTLSPNKSASKTSPITTDKKTTAHLYEGIINQPQLPGIPNQEKEYKITGYKNPATPILLFIQTYGPLSSAAFSLLAFSMVLVKMKRYRYEKESLMALVLAAAIIINAYYLPSLVTA